MAEEGQPRGVGGRKLAAGPFAAVAGALVIASTVVALRPASRFLATGPTSLAAQRVTSTASGLGLRLDAAELAELRDNIAAHPLNGNLLALAGLEASARGDHAQADALTTQALAVEPRTRLAWLWRAVDRSRADRPVEAVDSLLRVLAVDLPRYVQYMPLLAQLANDPRTKPVLTRALQADPPWRTPFLQLLAANGTDPAYLFGVAAKGASAPALLDSDRATVLSSLLRKGDYERAYLAWLSYLPEDAVPAVATPYDGRFRGMPGPPPFNWVLLDQGGDSAATGPDGLDVAYSGRAAAALASQDMLLPVRRYSIVVESQIAPRGGPSGEGVSPLAWQIVCRPSGAVLATLALPYSGRRTARSALQFDVPAGCAAVLLTLAGTPPEFPTPITGRIARTAITPAATAEAPQP